MKSHVSEIFFYMRFQKQINVLVYRDRHDSNLKNSRFEDVTKHNEEYLGVLDINVLFSQKIFS